MTVTDKILINLHKGFLRLRKIAEVFSERVKFELGVIRMRVRIDDIKTRIAELHAVIGRKAIELREAGGENGRRDLFGDDETAAALAEIATLRKELDDIAADLAREQNEIIEEAKRPGETKA